MSKQASNDLRSNGIEMIPGMGIVRIRCLRKAGWHTVGALGDATVEQIAAVPGIGSAKAREIKDYLDSLPGTKAPNGAPQRITERVESIAPNAMAAVARISQLATEILSAPVSHTFERPLARQVGRIASIRADSAALSSLKPRRSDRLEAQSRKLEALLSDLFRDKKLGRKRQERLAGELRDRRRKICRALGNPKNPVQSE